MFLKRLNYFLDYAHPPLQSEKLFCPSREPPKSLEVRNIVEYNCHSVDRGTLFSSIPLPLRLAALTSRRCSELQVLRVFFYEPFNEVHLFQSQLNRVKMLRFTRYVSSPKLQKKSLYLSEKIAQVVGNNYISLVYLKSNAKKSQEKRRKCGILYMSFLFSF